MNHKPWMVFFLILLMSKITYGAEEKLRDPTQPPPNIGKAVSKKTVSHFKLSQIRITQGDRQAVINGRPLRKGNIIANYRLQKIARGYVILANEKGKIRLNLINPDVIRKKL